MKFESQQVTPENNDYVRLGILWNNYGFMGNPPKEESPVLQRFNDACEAYVKFVESDNLNDVVGSQSARRNLHNEIALMVLGRKRSGMELKKAESITEFVCRYTRGVSCSELMKDFENDKREKAVS
jgi:hypothetical protein